ncbi:MAG: glycosyltransferase family 2 protein [Bdellovibrionales bacterium]|nr:glycosyltransferase family 2 protein [Bdellovibrionales bacterium]
MKYSVVIPTFNRPELLKRLLKSIGEQSIPPQEVVILNDGRVLNETESNYSDLLLKATKLTLVQDGKNLGGPARRNQGVKLAGTEFVFIVDDDDYWMSNLSEEFDRYINERVHAPFGMICAWAFRETHLGAQSLMKSPIDPLHAERFYREILKVNFVPSPTVCVVKSAFEEVGGYDEKLVSAQDWDLWVRLAEKFKCHMIPKTLAIHSEHEGERISTSSKRFDGYKAFYRKHVMKYVKLGSPEHLARALFFIATPAKLIPKIKSVVK